MKYPNILAAVHNTAWAILPEKLEAIMCFLERKAAGESIEYEAVKPTKFTAVKGDVAILPLYGVISQRVNMCSKISGGTSTDQFGAEFDAAVADSSIGAIVIDVDSPGGTTYGTHEMANKIHAARGTKPIVAVVNSLMASAAYWIGSAADEITMTPSGEVGSIGVLAIHSDVSEAEKEAGIKHTIVKAGKFKTEGNSHEPLSDEGLSAIQSRVDEYYDMFTADVAKFRDVTQSAVKNGFGQGRVVGAVEAKELGMIDRIGTYEAVVSRLITPKPKRSKSVQRRRVALLQK
jgi:signal peptide peptidase SppA